MSAEAHLPLLLDAPLQSWGVASRFQRRTTGLHPTKSAVVGMLCAAMGVAKGQDERAISRLAQLVMTSMAFARNSGLAPALTNGRARRRVEDFHTVGGGYARETHPQSIPRKASGGSCDNPTVTHRQYLADARFGIILTGDRALLDNVATALRNPVWGVWFGRKSCIPAAPLLPDPAGQAVFAVRREAFEALLRGVCRIHGREPPAEFPDEADYERVTETGGPGDAIRDVPVSFGDGTSSGPDKRCFAVRRVVVRPGRVEPPTG